MTFLNQFLHQILQATSVSTLMANKQGGPCDWALCGSHRVTMLRCLLSKLASCKECSWESGFSAAIRLRLHPFHMGATDSGVWSSLPRCVSAPGYGAMRTFFLVVSEEALIFNLCSLHLCLDLGGKPSCSGDLVSSPLIPSGPWDLLHFKPCLGICFCKY